MKNTIKLIGIILILLMLCLSITGCGNNEEVNQNENAQETIQEELKLNSELEDICAFAQKNEEGNNSKIVALKEDGTEIEITKLDSKEYQDFDYYGGKLYLQKEKNFYEIDLTK